MKPENKQKLRKRAENALCELHHNATLPFNYDEMPDGVAIHYGVQDKDEYLFNWINSTAMFEIEYIQGGGAYGAGALVGKSYVEILKSNAERKYTSTATRRYYVRWGLRQVAMDRAKGGRWERILEYGQVYQWGRGGRTLAPDGLIRQGGGSSFGIDLGALDNTSWEELTDLTLTVEAFNWYVKATCAAFPEMWREKLDEMAADLKWDVAEDLEATRPDMYAYTPAEIHAS